MDNYGFISLIPTILVIVLAWRTKQVMMSIITGIFVGATIINGYNPLTGILRTFDHYIVESIADSWNVSILVLNFAFGGMIAIMAKSGGMGSLSNTLANRAKNVKNTQFSIWILGIIIYFDEIFNILIIGNAMKPVTDRFRISREKLAYLIDTTGSAVASLVPLSTWIAYEVGLIRDSYAAMNVDVNAFTLLVKSIPYRFYSIFVILIPLIILFSKREFGPMYNAELRTRKTGKVIGDNAIPLSTDEIKTENDGLEKHMSSRCTFIIILMMIVGTITGLYLSGGGSSAGSISNAFGNADAAKALVWASFGGSILTGLLVLLKKIMPFKQIMDTWVDGSKSILFANMIIVLAWSIGAVTKDLGTANYIVESTRGMLSPTLVPFIVFIIAAITSFSTGTSWGTMALLMPIAVPLVYSIGGPMAPAIGSVLTGSIFGDHCSPVSDTTILSSMASGCDHMDHVKTQLPYAIAGAAVAAVFGFLPAGFGLSSIILLPLGVIALIIIFRVFGKKVEDNYI